MERNVNAPVLNAPIEEATVGNTPVPASGTPADTYPGYADERERRPGMEERGTGMLAKGYHKTHDHDTLGPSGAIDPAYAGFGTTSAAAPVTGVNVEDPRYGTAGHPNTELNPHKNIDTAPYHSEETRTEPGHGPGLIDKAKMKIEEIKERREEKREEREMRRNLENEREGYVGGGPVYTGTETVAPVAGTAYGTDGNVARETGVTSPVHIAEQYAKPAYTRMEDCHCAEPREPRQEMTESNDTAYVADPIPDTTAVPDEDVRATLVLPDSAGTEEKHHHKRGGMLGHMMAPGHATATEGHATVKTI